MDMYGNTSAKFCLGLSYSFVNIALIIAEGTRLNRSGVTDSTTSAVIAALQAVAYVALCAKVQSYTSWRHERPIVLEERRARMGTVAEINACCAGILGIASTVFCWLTWSRLEQKTLVSLSQIVWTAANTVSAVRFHELVCSYLRGYWPQKNPVVNVQVNDALVGGEVVP